ncbi:MAG: DUF1559 domain-containing protein [Gemmataceae bacterium]|nr:DUF1559 domain-containing protein [Gemmataceae bacterium]
MSRYDRVTHWLPRLTCWLGLFTTLLGMIAWSFRSWMEAAFIAFSIATFSAYFVVLFKRSAREDALKRFGIAMVGVLPLASLWGFLTLNVERGCHRNYSKTQMHNNCKNIGLGLVPDPNSAKHVTTDVRDPAGGALLSWRVSILPYLDQAPLHNQFNFKQPWDSRENGQHLDKKPSIYGSNVTDVEPTHTLWQGFVGPGTAFEPGKRLNVERDFPDGLATTLLIVEGETSVPWTKPADIVYGPNHRLPAFTHKYSKEGGLPFRGYVSDPGAFACMADGSVRFLRANISEEVLRAMIVRNDGKPAEVPD